jgi:ribosomal protein L37AE/L43A
MAYSCCPNCGNPKFEENRKDFACPSCGFKKTEFKKVEDCSIFYCEGCGCNYTNGCTVHPASMQKKTKF